MWYFTRYINLPFIRNVFVYIRSEYKPLLFIWLWKMIHGFPSVWSFIFHSTLTVQQLKLLTFYAIDMTITGQGVMVGKYPGMVNIFCDGLNVEGYLAAVTPHVLWIYMYIYIPVFIVFTYCKPRLYWLLLLQLQSRFINKAVILCVE